MFRSFIIFLTFSFLAFQTGAKHGLILKDVDYVETSAKDYDKVEHKLDIYLPEQNNYSGRTLLFIHGGSWESGHKETYKLLGKAFAANGIITVVINYRLSPKATYDEMAYDCARAVAWVKKNSGEYSADTNQLFVSGHSAGGHLAALITLDETYFRKAGITNPIKGVILNDAFGLNIFKYLDHGYKGDATFRNTFTNEPAAWKKGSPFFYIKRNSVRYYILTGTKTYPVIKSEGQDFNARNIEVGNSSELHTIKRKRHIAMILLFFGKKNAVLKDVVAFIKK